MDAFLGDFYKKMIAKDDKIMEQWSKVIEIFGATNNTHSSSLTFRTQCQPRNSEESTLGTKC